MPVYQIVFQYNGIKWYPGISQCCNKPTLDIVGYIVLMSHHSRTHIYMYIYNIIYIYIIIIIIIIIIITITIIIIIIIIITIIIYLPRYSLHSRLILMVSSARLRSTSNWLNEWLERLASSFGRRYLGAGWNVQPPLRMVNTKKCWAFWWMFIQSKYASSCKVVLHSFAKLMYNFNN